MCEACSSAGRTFYPIPSARLDFAPPLLQAAAPVPPVSHAESSAGCFQKRRRPKSGPSRHGLRAPRITNETIQRIRKITNRIQAIFAEAPAIPENPSTPAISAMTRNTRVQCSMMIWGWFRTYIASWVPVPCHRPASLETKGKNPHHPFVKSPANPCRNAPIPAQIATCNHLRNPQPKGNPHAHFLEA